MEADQRYSRSLPQIWPILVLFGISTALWLVAVIQMLSLAPLLRYALVALLNLLVVALVLIYRRSLRRSLLVLGSTLHRLASGRTEVRAPAELTGLYGMMSSDINRIAQQLGELNSRFEDAVQQTTLRLRRERDELLAQNQQLRVGAGEAQEEARQQSERLSSMSHELRTPLTGILGYADLLRRTKLDAEQLQHLDTLDKSARALLTMINDLLDWSRIEAGRLKLDELRFDLYDTVESTVALLAPLAYEKNLELVRIIYHDVPRELRGDAQRLRQILTNLLSNAIKFTEQGEVVLRVMGEREEPGRHWLRFAVADTGVGIAPDQQARLFQPFRQVGRAHGGSGLGLSISRKLAELMGGEINLESTPGSGSTFSALLPFKLNAADESAVHEDRPLGEHRVWLYEPHHAARLAWLHWLEFWGLSVQSFGSLEPLSEALLNIAAERRPAVVVLGLPAADVDKPELARLLRNCREHGPPALMLVNSVSPPLLEQLRQLGAAICHPKSVTRQRLYNDLAGLLNPQTQALPPLSGKQALVADNNLVNRRYLVRLCAELGLKTSEAKDGREAFERWLTVRPDIVLLDAKMPELDGAGCARAIRAAEKGESRCRILAVSAHLEPDERRDFLAAGADEVLIKPFDEAQLLAALEPALRRESHSAAKLAQDPELLSLLTEELPAQLADLEREISGERLQQARDAAHTLRGTAAFYHLAQLKQTTAAMESWLKNQDVLTNGPVVRQKLDSVRRAVDETLTAMRGEGQRQRAKS